MLEALYQASMWLVSVTENFAHSVLTLDEVRNVKFADFMEPGQELTVRVEWVKADDQTVTVKATGMRGDVTAVSGRLVIGKRNLGASEVDQLSSVDEFSREAMRKQVALLRGAAS